MKISNAGLSELQLEAVKILKQNLILHQLSKTFFLQSSERG